MSSIENKIIETVKIAVKEAINEEIVSAMAVAKNDTSENQVTLSSSVPKDPLSIIRPNELCEILSISKATLHRMEHADQLPKKIRFGSRSVGWLRSDIERWLLKR